MVFKGPGPSPDVILRDFLGETSFHEFLVDFFANFEKMRKVKFAQNTIKNDRFDHSAVPKKRTQITKKHIETSLKIQ